MLSSETFHGSALHAKFLRYAVEQTLEGHEEDLKEFSIGIEVFGRTASFDPRKDNVVRIQAGRLRSRLAIYYQSEGANDPVRIDFPKGGYSPAFRSNTSPVPPSDTALEGGGVNEAAASYGVPVLRWKAAPWKPAAAFVVLALAATGAGVHFVRSARQANSPSVDSSSIAVLPFLNRSDDKEGEIFADGLTDELIDSLGRVPGIHVVGQSSAFQFKDKIVDIRKIGPALSVRTVLEGSVRKYGSRLRITAQLDDTTNGYRLWSESYDRELKDALAIQRDISQAIVGALGVPLAANAMRGRLRFSRGAAEVNTEAYEDYLRGRYAWNKQTPESIKNSIGYFEQALALDSTYAAAYAGLAQCYAVLPAFTIISPPEIVPRIEAAAFRALQLDDTLGQAHLDLASAYEFENRWAEAEKEFQKGLELNPGDEMAHRWYATYLMKVGRSEEALAENQKALDLDPVSPYMAQGMGGSLFYARRYDDAIEQYRKALALEPNFGMTHRGLAVAYIQKGMYSQAISELQTSRQLVSDDSSVSGYLGYAYALSGNKAKANEILRGLLSRSRSEPSLALGIARIYVGLGDKGDAFQWLETAIDHPRPFLLLKVDPLFDPLRSDPRFAGLLRRMNLS